MPTIAEDPNVPQPPPPQPPPADPIIPPIKARTAAGWRYRSIVEEYATPGAARSRQFNLCY